jgi:hypothetical protein
MPALGQTHRASLRGTLYDPLEAAIALADVTLTNVDTGNARSMTTGEDGEYAFTSLPPGRYELKIQTRQGFIPQTHKIELSVNEELVRDITLTLGHDNITVDATFEAHLKKETASLGTVIENRQVTGLPLDGRNFYELGLLVPGAVPPAPGSAGSVRGDFAFSVNGAREDANNFLLDGVYNLDPKLNTFGVRPSVEAIREFEMLTSTYDASFGRNPGAQINVILQSGSNGLHGSLFEIHRTRCA